MDIKTSQIDKFINEIDQKNKLINDLKMNFNQNQDEKIDKYKNDIKILDEANKKLLKENENLKQSNVVLIQSTNPELLKISQSICRYKEKMKESKLLLNDEDIVKECLDNNFEEINELKKENENLKNKIKNLEEEIKVKTKETETKILSLSQKYSDSEEEEFDINFLAKNAKEKNNSEDIKIDFPVYSDIKEKYEEQNKKIKELKEIFKNMTSQIVFEEGTDIKSKINRISELLEIEIENK